MIEVRYDDKWKDLIDEKQLKETLKVFVEKLFDKEYGISLYITDDYSIQKLNKKFCNKDHPTDILSWNYLVNFSENDSEIILESKNSKISGEIVVSAERLIEQSIENGWNFKTELFRILAHGCAHLKGMDHENSATEAKKMLELEIKLLKKVGLNNIY